MGAGIHISMLQWFRGVGIHTYNPVLQWFIESELQIVAHDWLKEQVFVSLRPAMAQWLRR
jgi:hypothetical protein